MLLNKGGIYVDNLYLNGGFLILGMILIEIKVFGFLLFVKFICWIWLYLFGILYEYKYIEFFFIWFLYVW